MDRADIRKGMRIRHSINSALGTIKQIDPLRIQYDKGSTNSSGYLIDDAFYNDHPRDFEIYNEPGSTFTIGKFFRLVFRPFTSKRT